MADELINTWVDELVKKAEERIGEIKNKKTRKTLDSVLGAVYNHKDDIIKLGKDNVLELFGLIGRGKEIEAQEFFIRKTATADDLIAGMNESAKKIAEAKKIDWEKTITDLIVTIGTVGAKELLPFLIGLL